MKKADPKTKRKTGNYLPINKRKLSILNPFLNKFKIFALLRIKYFYKLIMSTPLWAIFADEQLISAITNAHFDSLD